MENASKALIMAGGILLAIMILAILVSVGISMSDMAKSQDVQLATQQLKAFNESYLAYNKSVMYGADVLSVYNKAEDESDYDIEISAIDKNNNGILIENTQSFKISVFKCEEVNYDNQTGRINKMIFRKIET